MIGQDVPDRLEESAGCPRPAAILGCWRPFAPTSDAETADGCPRPEAPPDWRPFAGKGAAQDRFVANRMSKDEKGIGNRAYLLS